MAYHFVLTARVETVLISAFARVRGEADSRSHVRIVPHAVEAEVV